jgi:hypothetical protein
MKYLLILFTIFLCACGTYQVEKSDGKTHDIQWPNDSCRGIVDVVAVKLSQFEHYGIQFVARCDDGRIVHNLSNFIIK